LLRLNRFQSFEEGRLKGRSLSFIASKAINSPPVLKSVQQLIALVIAKPKDFCYNCNQAPAEDHDGLTYLFID
jgi:hypothetical protein